MKEEQPLKQPVSIFYSYAHEDRGNREKLSKYLATLRREQKIKEWFDDDILPGDNFSTSINENLYTAEIIILIISIDFINSDYCWQLEMPEALRLQKEGKSSVIPVMIRPISIEFGHTPFGHLKMLPKDGKPITRWSNRELAWVDVATGIKQSVDDIYANRKAKPAREKSKTAATAIKRSATVAITKPIIAAPDKKLHRIICDQSLKTKDKKGFQIVREEGHPPVKDKVANIVYDNLGKVYDFFRSVYKRNSVDDKGLPLKANIHYLKRYENAFWDGREFFIGDGGQLLQHFYEVDIIANEFSLGVFQYETNLEFWGETGAIIRSCGHVFGSLAKQYCNMEDAQHASWILGENIVKKKGIARGLLSLSDPGTAFVNSDLGDDPGISHTRDMPKTAKNDRSDIARDAPYIIAGIGDKAFYLSAIMIGGNAWEIAGMIWYKTICSKKLPSNCTLSQFADTTIETAVTEFGKEGIPAIAVGKAWNMVGVVPKKIVKTRH